MVNIVSGSFSNSIDKANEEYRAKQVRVQKLKAEVEKSRDEKIKKEQAAYDAKYYKQSKETIIKDLKLSMQSKDYSRVVYRTVKFLSYKGKDDDIAKMNVEARALLEADKLAKIKLANEKHEKEILKQLKKIPSSNFRKNKELYKTLLNYKPNNKKYKEKVEFYTDKIIKQEKEIADRLVKFGKPPTQSAWDGSYYVVENYLEKVAKNPDSVDISNCSKVMYSDNGWVVKCTWRGQNGFGGMNVQSNRFTIRHDRVIGMN